ncbi:MAG: hypothetical protein WC794_03760 [Candidatus Doudnabacteria bacterium]
MRTFFALGMILSLATFFGLPQVAVASTNLDVSFETGAPPTAMFQETNFLPGDTVTKWAKVTNKTTASQSIVAKLTNYSNPDGLGDYFDVVIKEHSSSTNLFSGTMTDFAALPQLVLESALVPNVQKQYDFSVTFKPETGNPYQEKTLSFDFVISLQGTDVGGCEGSDCGGGGGTVTTFGGGGISGGGGGTPGNPSNPPGLILGDNTGSFISMPKIPADPGQVLGASTLPKTGLPPILWVITLFIALGLASIKKKKMSN